MCVLPSRGRPPVLCIHIASTRIRQDGKTSGEIHMKDFLTKAYHEAKNINDYLRNWSEKGLGKPKYLRMEKREGWLRELPIFEFMCPKHGKQENYMQGREKVLECPICQKERMTR